MAELKRMALNLLSRRDYSENQLSLRLGRQGGDPADIALVIAWCKRENYLDQNRFLQMVVRSRAGKGYGLNYIVQECRQQQIAKEQVVQCAAELEIDWFAMASQGWPWMPIARQWLTIMTNKWQVKLNAKKGDHGSD